LPSLPPRRWPSPRMQIPPHRASAFPSSASCRVDKAAALARWCARLGVDAADVWAFGDMPNDLPMLTWAGRGIAVANAHRDVLAGADAVVGHHDADGVAEELAAVLDRAAGASAGDRRA